MGRLYSFIIFCFRLFYPRYRYSGPGVANDPAVYIVHHQNLRGPVTVLGCFPQFLRPWIFHVFLTRRECYRHFIDYTFTERFGLPKILASIIVWPISFFIPKLMQVIGAIPVYRDRRAVTTFKQSISALADGQSLLICPDIDYADESNTVGEIYSGFLNLEKYYHKKSGQHLAFIPLYIDQAKRSILQGKTIFFPGQKDFNEEKVQMSERLRRDINELANL